MLSKAERYRLQEILHTLIKHKLGWLIAKAGLRKFLPVTKHLHTVHFEESELKPYQITNTLEELGGPFIKLGQLLSLRPDLIPSEYCDHLTKLQDKVRPISDETVRFMIESEFGKELRHIFRSFDPKPIAAASIGQVHRAVLKDGTEVVVKVQRPGLTKKFETDIKLLYRFADIIIKHFNITSFDPYDIIQEFERYSQNELDYFKEAHNIDYMGKTLSKNSDLRIPKVYWDYCTEKILTMEYLDGTLLHNIKSKHAKKKVIAKKILNASYEQIFMNGFFHADPHPGNFIIGRDFIGQIDFGIVGRLDSDLKEILGELFIGMTNADLDTMVNAAIRLGITTESSDSRALKNDLYNHLAQYYDTPLNKIDISKVFRGIIHIMRKNNLKISSDFVLLSKAVITLEGVVRHLDPKYNFVKEAKPFIRRLKHQNLDPRHIAKRLQHKTREFAQFIDTVPRKSTILLNELTATNHDLFSIDKDLSRLKTSVNTSSNRVVLGFLGGCTFIASALMLPFSTRLVFGVPALSFFGFSISLLLILGVVVSILKEKNTNY